MSRSNFFPQALRPYLPMAVVFFAVCVLLLLPDMAHATSTTDLPFATALDKVREAIKGPVAFTVSLIGIVAAGAVLIFGGEMSGFLRTLVFLVLVIAIIVNAGNLVQMLGGDAALIAAQVEQSVSAIRGAG
jgi:type IV secretion system protein TrbC